MDKKGIDWKLTELEYRLITLAESGDCPMLRSYAAFSSALLVAMFSPANKFTVIRTYQELTWLFEMGENNWHAAVRGQGDFNVMGFHPPFPFWKVLHKLQEYLWQAPWSLPCETHNRCPACRVAKGNQVEWYFERAQVNMVHSEPSQPTEFKTPAGKREAWVTLLTSSKESLETYIEAVRTLAYSVRRLETEKRDFVVLTWLFDVELIFEE